MSHRLIQLIVPALQHVTYPSDLDKKRALFSLQDDSLITSLILTHMLDFLLLSYRYRSHPASSSHTCWTSCCSPTGTDHTQPHPHTHTGLPPPLLQVPPHSLHTYMYRSFLVLYLHLTCDSPHHQSVLAANSRTCLFWVDSSFIVFETVLSSVITVSVQGRPRRRLGRDRDREQRAPSQQVGFPRDSAKTPTNASSAKTPSHLNRSKRYSTNQQHPVWPAYTECQFCSYIETMC